jgi:hypothetical protein
MTQILAIDQGTTLTRSTHSFQRVGPAHAGTGRVSTVFPRPGWVEHEPAAHPWRTSLSTARASLTPTWWPPPVSPTSAKPCSSWMEHLPRMGCDRRRRLHPQSVHPWMHWLASMALISGSRPTVVWSARPDRFAQVRQANTIGHPLALAKPLSRARWPCGPAR